MRILLNWEDSVCQGGQTNIKQCIFLPFSSVYCFKIDEMGQGEDNLQVQCGLEEVM